MPQGQQRLSAVARQRSHCPTPPTLPTSGSLAPVKAANDSLFSSSTGTQGSSTTLKAVASELNDSPSTCNQFSRLVSTENVDFLSAREIERLSYARVKIRLVRGQKCVVLGLCTLWVKDGSVIVYGATIPASNEVYHIFAPNTHALPVIEAVTKSTEFELDSFDDGLQALPDIGIQHLWSPAGVSVTSNQTYFVLGHSFGLDPKFPFRLKSLDLDQWKQTITRVSAPIQSRPGSEPLNSKAMVAGSLRRVLACGRRSSGSSTFVRCLLNYMVTLRTAEGSLQYPDGVILLDFDCNLPEFTPPGTLALVQVKRPVFGPPFSHLLHRGSVKNIVITAHFTGEVGSEGLPERGFMQMLNLLEMEKTKRPHYTGCPVVISAPSWFDSLDSRLVENLWSKMEVTDLVYLDSSSVPAQPTTWKPFIDRKECSFHLTQSVSVFHKLSSAREHDMQMQSFFHMCSYQFDRPHWDDLPILTDLPTHSVDYYGAKAVIKAVLFLADGVSLEATCDTLKDSIVAVVAVSKSHFETYKARDDDNLVYTNREDLPRILMTPGKEFPLPADASTLLGFAYVHEVEVEVAKLRLTPTLSGDDWPFPSFRDHVIVLVVPNGMRDGRFRSQWMQKELSHARINSDQSGEQELENGSWASSVEEDEGSGSGSQGD